jgi:hypothetical protein
MAEYIAPGTTLLPGADFTVVAGTPQTLFLKQASGDNVGAQANVDFEVQHKTSGGTYTTLFILNSGNHPKQITAPGTYRVRRLASTGSSAGLDKE